ncbi:hypothetical protein [Nonomuraea monospora]|uniref:hypothetical protein n=1 Tax=Nonomuraea monospora TaxID=568818 RepID=UPI0031D048D7
MLDVLLITAIMQFLWQPVAVLIAHRVGALRVMTSALAETSLALTRRTGFQQKPAASPTQFPKSRHEADPLSCLTGRPPHAATGSTPCHPPESGSASA